MLGRVVRGSVGAVAAVAFFAAALRASRTWLAAYRLEVQALAGASSALALHARQHLEARAVSQEAQVSALEAQLETAQRALGVMDRAQRGVGGTAVASEVVEGAAVLGVAASAQVVAADDLYQVSPLTSHHSPFTLTLALTLTLTLTLTPTLTRSSASASRRRAARTSSRRFGRSSSGDPRI